MTFEEKRQIIEELLKIQKGKHLIDIRKDEIELLATLNSYTHSNNHEPQRCNYFDTLHMYDITTGNC